MISDVEMDQCSNTQSYPVCYICLESDCNVIKACLCNFAHHKCLSQVIIYNNSNICCICNTQYLITETHSPSHSSSNIGYKMIFGIFMGCLCGALVYTIAGINLFVYTRSPNPNPKILYVLGIIGTVCHTLYQMIYLYKYLKRIDMYCFFCILFDIIWALMNQIIGYAYFNLYNSIEQLTIISIYNYLIGMCITCLPCISIVCTTQYYVHALVQS